MYKILHLFLNNLNLEKKNVQLTAILLQNSWQTLPFQLFEIVVGIPIKFQLN